MRRPAAPRAGDRRRRRPRATSCARAPRAAGVADRVRFLGNLSQDDVGALARRGRRRGRARRCGTTAATSTACRTSCWRRWPRARRWSRRRPAASARVVEDERTGAGRPGARRRSASPRRSRGWLRDPGAGARAWASAARADGRRRVRLGARRRAVRGRLRPRACLQVTADDKIYGSSDATACRAEAWAQRVLPRLQRQRHDREPGDHARCRRRRELTPDFEVIVVNDGSADATARDRSTSSRAPTRRSASSTTRRTAATAARCDRLRGGDART